MLDKLAVMLRQAWASFDAGQLDEADLLYSELLSGTCPETKEYEDALYGMGFVRSHQGRFEEARQCYAVLLERARSKGDFWKESICLHQLGMVERMAKRCDDAIQLFAAEHALLVKHFPDNAGHLAANYYEQGYVTLLQGRIGESEPLMVKSLEFAERSGDPMVSGCSLRGMGEIVAAQGKGESALRYFSASCQAFAEANDPLAVAEVEKLMAAIPSTG